MQEIAFTRTLVPELSQRNQIAMWTPITVQKQLAWCLGFASRMHYCNDDASQTILSEIQGALRDCKSG